MKSQRKNDFPLKNGNKFTVEEQNSYSGTMPKAPKEHLDVSLFTKWSGEQNLIFSVSANQAPKNYELIPKTNEEQEEEEKFLLLKSLSQKHSSLAYATLGKIWILLVVVLLGMVAEFLIYQSIAENAFGMTLTKSFLIGLLVLLFTKFVQTAIQKYIKHWVKENSIRYRTITKTLIFVLVALVLLNAMMLGITNLNQIHVLHKIERVEYLASAISEAQLYDEDSSDMEEEYGRLQNQLNRGDNAFFMVAKYLGIALIAILTICCGAILFATVDLNLDSYRTKKKLEKLKDHLEHCRAKFGYYLSTYESMRILQKEIIELYGQKAFYEKLLSGKTDESLIVQTNNLKS